MQHATGKIFGDWLGNEVQVLEHFIRVPPPQKLDDVSVNIGQKESHGPSSEE